jgi:hypothetical protein
MRRPTNAELIIREREATFETKQVSANEIERVDNSTMPNARLFDKIVTEVKGYRLKSEPREASDAFRVPSPELLAAIPTSHKNAFVDGLYVADAEFIDEEDDFVVGGDVTLPVNFYIGDKDKPHATIRFELPECNEDEREKVGRRATQLRERTGSKLRHTVITTNLQASIDFFVDLMGRPGAYVSENGKVNGVSFAEAPDKRVWAAGIDPVFMTIIVGAAFSRYAAKRQDS